MNANPQEFRNAVLHAGYDLQEQYGLNNFDAHGIEQLLQEPGREVNSSGDVSQACEYLLEKGLLKRGTYRAYGITASGIDEVESNR